MSGFNRKTQKTNAGLTLLLKQGENIVQIWVSMTQVLIQVYNTAVILTRSTHANVGFTLVPTQCDSVRLGTVCRLFH